MAWVDEQARHAGARAGFLDVVASLSGDLDIASVPALSGCLEQVRARQPRVVVYDLSQVTFLDCAAARVIISAAHGPDGAQPVLRHPRPIVRRMLSLAGFDRQCVIED
jgi:anti-anti-sigma factor